MKRLKALFPARTQLELDLFLIHQEQFSFPFFWLFQIFGDLMTFRGDREGYKNRVIERRRGYYSLNPDVAQRARKRWAQYDEDYQEETVCPM